MKIKKICAVIFIFTIICCVFDFNGCKKSENILLPYVSELRQNLYVGECDGFKVMATYGYKETPYSTNGKVGTKQYKLTFILPDITEPEVTYSLTFKYNDTEYKADFKLNVTRHSLTATLPIENFNESTFTVTILKASTVIDVTLNSIVPQGTLSYKGALDALIAKQSALLNAYVDSNGNFNGEIYERIIVKDGKAYWYIGIADEKGGVKALLIDGSSGELLAVREVF